MTHSLTLGSLLLTASFPDDEHGFVFDILAEGVGFGVAVGVKGIVTSLLADGDIVRIDRYGNREVAFKVEITGPSLDALAQGEAALRREVGRANVLTWQAPDLLAVPTAFDVVTSEMAQEFDDLDELNKRRIFQVTLTCAPFARSVDMVTVPALEVPVTENLVTVDTCDSATNWTAFVNGTSVAPDTTWQAGAVSVKELLTPGPQTLQLTRTATVDFSSTRYLRAEIGYNSSLGALPVILQAYGPSTPRMTTAGVPLVEQRLLSKGRFLYVYDLEGYGSVDSLSFSSYTTADYADLKIHNLSRTDMPPRVTPRQASRNIDVVGTERTPASIHVASADGVSALDQVIFHSCPRDGSGYSPPMRRWRVSGNAVTPTFDAMSGAYEPIHPNPYRAEVPNSALPPGGYILAARMASDTPGAHRVAWSTSTIAPFGSANLVGGIEDVQFFSANQWVIVPLAFVTLPTIATTGTDIVTRVDVQRYSGAALINVDEVWLFRAEDDCALTVVGGVPGHLWLDSPGVESNLVPRVWLSASADRGNMRHPADSLLAGDAHVLHPDGTTVFTAAVSDNPVTEATFYPLWHSNAAS